MPLALEIVKGPEKGRVFELAQTNSYLAGRAAEAGLRFSEKDPYISRRHFILEVTPECVYFKSLDVTNPSRVNDIYTDETQLHDGDVIEAGYTRLKVIFQLEMTGPEDQGPGEGAGEGDAPLEPGRPPSPPASSTPESEGLQGPICLCGRDLSDLADSDGRYGRIGGKALYLCPDCLPAKDESAGRRIGDYVVVRKLGEGGMGKVYLAHHPATARVAAIKQLNIHNPQRAKRFVREIRIMKNSDHPNILGYIDNDLDAAGNKPFLVMEYCSGGSLQNLLEETGPGVSAEQTCQYILQVLAGLEFLHENGIVHRDLKPENILLKPGDDGRMTAKITDFGLSREFLAAGGTNLTGMGVAMGTILYMPPEQIRDAHGVKETADLYSLGATMYHLLSGKYPFDFPTPADLVRYMAQERIKENSPLAALKLMMKKKQLKTPHLIVLEDEPVPLASRVPALSAALCRIVDKCIRKEPGERYASARELRQALESCLALA